MFLVSSAVVVLGLSLGLPRVLGKEFGRVKLVLCFGVAKGVFLWPLLGRVPRLVPGDVPDF